MRVYRRLLPALTCIGVLLASACAARETGAIPSVMTAGNAKALQPVRVRQKVRAVVRILIPRWRRTRNPRLLHMHFVAASTQAVKVQAYVPNSVHGPGTLRDTAVANLAPGSPACVTGTQGRTCTFTISIPPPADDLVFTTWDQAPAHGAIPAAAKQLAAAVEIAQKIETGRPNALSLTLGGVVASVGLSLPNSSIVGGTQTTSIHGVVPSTQNVGVDAYDADGNVILADGFVDANGSPLNVDVSVTASSSTCGSGTLQLGATTPGNKVVLSQPPATPIAFAYGATSFAALFTPSTACTFAIAAVENSASANAQFALLGPQITEIALSNGSSFPDSIVAGPDGAMWFTECATGKVGRVTTASTPVINEYPLASSTSQPAAIANGPDGKLWFTESRASKVGNITTDGVTIHEYATKTGNSGPAGIVAGPDHAMWFAENSISNIARVTTDGVTMNEYPIPTPDPARTTAPARPIGITNGSDGALWFTESFGDAIGRITTAGTITNIYTSGIALQRFPTAITNGPDGALWFAESCGIVAHSGVGRITTSGTATEPYLTPANPYAQCCPQGIVSGPDGALWFTLGPNAIGRLTTDGTFTDYITPTSNSLPGSIAVGPDNDLWFTECQVGKIGRLSW